MSNERFIAAQLKGVNVIFVMFVTLASTMWVATLCDWAFNLRWGWDRQILWLAPPMVLFALVLRLFCTAIFKFVGDNNNGS